jgi:hypothetical protein
MHRLTSEGVRVLEEECRPFLPKEVERVVRERNLSFPGEVGIAFRASWRFSPERVTLSDVEARLGEEVLRFPKRGFFGDALDENPVLQALKRGFARTLDAFRKGAERGSPLEEVSTDMRIFLRAFVEHKDPLGALAEERFLAHAKAGLFLDL